MELEIVFVEAAALVYYNFHSILNPAFGLTFWFFKWVKIDMFYVIVVTSK